MAKVLNYLMYLKYHSCLMSLMFRLCLMNLNYLMNLKYHLFLMCQRNLTN